MSVAITIHKKMDFKKQTQKNDQQKIYDLYEIDQFGKHVSKSLVFEDLQNQIQDLDKRDVDIFDEDKGYKISSIILKDNTIIIQVDYVRMIIMNT